MTTSAIANDFKVCQSFLGAKIHDPKDPGADLSSMLYQVVSVALDLMEQYSEKWKTVKSTEPVPSFGFNYAVGLEPVSVNVEKMIEKFRLGVKELIRLWKEFLSKDIIDFLQRAAALPRDKFNFPDEIWVEIVYSFAIAAHKKLMNREHLLKSLTPLYIGRTASFVRETWESDAAGVEEKIERLCRIFEERKFFLKVNWQI
jgi:hypothetical protein